MWKKLRMFGTPGCYPFASLSWPASSPSMQQQTAANEDKLKTFEKHLNSIRYYPPRWSCTAHHGAKIDMANVDECWLSTHRASLRSFNEQKCNWNLKHRYHGYNVKNFAPYSQQALRTLLIKFPLQTVWFDPLNQCRTTKGRIKFVIWFPFRCFWHLAFWLVCGLPYNPSVETSRKSADATMHHVNS
jgi:hypothetical protein